MRPPAARRRTRLPAELLIYAAASSAAAAMRAPPATVLEAARAAPLMHAVLQVALLVAVGPEAAARADIPREMARLRARYPSAKCQEVWCGEHVAYRCKTCALSETSCLCIGCFRAEDHEGHDFHMYKSGTGGW